MSVPQLYLRNRVVQFLEAQRKVRSDWKAYTVSHFTEEGFSRPTIYRTISTYLARGSVEHGKGAGIGQWKSWHLATKIDCGELLTIPLVCLKIEWPQSSDVVNHTSPKHWKMDTGTLLNVEKEWKRLCTNQNKSKEPQKVSVASCTITRHRSLSSWTGYQMSGNLHYYSSDSKKAPIKVKTRAKSKFEPKVLWIAISEKGISTVHTNNPE